MQLEDYLNFDLSVVDIKSAVDYFYLLDSLKLSEKDICEEGNGYCCFGVTYRVEFDNEYSVVLEDLISYEKGLVLKFIVFDEEGDVVKREDKEFLLSSVEDVLKIAEKYGEDDGVIEYKGDLYFVLIGDGYDKPFIRLADETVVFVEDIEC